MTFSFFQHSEASNKVSVPKMRTHWPSESVIILEPETVMIVTKMKIQRLTSVVIFPFVIMSESWHSWIRFLWFCNISWVLWLHFLWQSLMYDSLKCLLQTKLPSAWIICVLYWQHHFNENMLLCIKLTIFWCCDD